MASYRKPDEFIRVSVPGGKVAVYSFGKGDEVLLCLHGGPGCTCDAKGVCTGSAEGSQGFPNPVKFNFPGDDVAEVVFDTCAFGCPEGK